MGWPKLAIAPEASWASQAQRLIGGTSKRLDPCAGERPRSETAKRRGTTPSIERCRLGADSVRPWATEAVLFFVTLPIGSSQRWGKLNVLLPIDLHSSFRSDSEQIFCFLFFAVRSDLTGKQEIGSGVT
jgi:hypothetical protein